MKSLKPIQIAIESHIRRLSEIEEQNLTNYGLQGELGVMLTNFLGYAYKVLSWKRSMSISDDQETDIYLIKLRITESDVIEFLHPVEIEEVTFGTKFPTPSPNPTALFQPFSVLVWFLLAVSMLTMAIAYLCIFRNQSFFNSVFSVLATALRQSPSFNPNTSSERILMGSWMFGMTIVTAGYMGLLLSYITFPHLRGVKSILELTNAVEKGDYQCFANNPYNDHLLSSGVKAQIIIGKNLNDSFDLQDFRKLPVKNVAFIFTKRYFKLLAPELFVSDDSLFTYLNGYSTRKDFRFKDKLNWAILRLIETGTYEKMFSKHYPRKIELAEAPELTRKLTLLDFKSVFIMLLMGYGVSILTFLLEILSFKPKQKSVKVKRRKGRKKQENNKSFKSRKGSSIRMI